MHTGSYKQMHKQLEVGCEPLVSLKVEKIYSIMHVNHQIWKDMIVEKTFCNSNLEKNDDGENWRAEYLGHSVC